MVKETKEYTIWLDAMRGLASLIVFLSHSRLVFFGSSAFAIGGLEIATQKAEQRVTQVEAAGLGHMAVIVFFVLSGYLVGGGAVRALRRNHWSASDYAIARISRLWTVLIPILAIGYLLDNYGHATAEAGSIYFGPSGQIAITTNLADHIDLRTLIGNLFFLQGILVAPFGTNFPLWTLAYEFWFYVAFPFLLFLVWPSSTASMRTKCAIVLLLIYALVGNGIAAYFCIWLLGVLVELAPQKIPRRFVDSASVACALSIVLLVGLLLKTKPPLVLTDYILGIAFMMFCYVVKHKINTVKKGVFAKVFVATSAISYTLYLSHMTILTFVSNHLTPKWEAWKYDVQGLTKYFVVDACIFVIIIALYWLFERNTPRVRRWLSVRAGAHVRRPRQREVSSAFAGKQEET